VLLTDQSGIITCLLVIIITCLLVIVIIITCLLVIIIITVIVIMQALTRYQIKQVTAPPQPSRDDNADNKASLTIVDSSGDELDGDAARIDASSCKQSSADAGPGPGPSEADDYKEDFEEYEEETSLQEEGLWSPDSKQAFIDVDRDTKGDVGDDSRSPSHPSLDVQRSVSQSLTEALV